MMGGTHGMFDKLVDESRHVQDRLVGRRFAAGRIRALARRRNNGRYAGGEARIGKGRIEGRDPRLGLGLDLPRPREHEVGRHSDALPQEIVELHGVAVHDRGLDKPYELVFESARVCGKVQEPIYFGFGPGAG